MPERTDALDQISVATPCSADWDEMLGNDEVRFCRHCSQHVHDLSQITRKEAMRLVAASQGRLCVRYRKRPDGTLDTIERAQPLRHIKRRLSRIAAGAFTASLSLASNVAAQSARPAVGNQPAAIQPASAAILGRVLTRGGRTASLSGTVFDTQRTAVPGAMVILVNDATGESQTATSNEEGVYQFQAVEAGTYTLTVEARGFSSFEQKRIVLRDGAEECIDASLMPGMIMGDMVLPSSPSTPLVKAVWEENLSEVRNLLARGVDVNMLDAGVDTTALAAAVSNGKLEIIRALLDAGADPNVKNLGGRTALMSLDGDATGEVVRVLVAAGADVSLRDESGNTALHAAAVVAKSEVLRALLDAGAMVNARSKVGQTALIEAAAYGHVDNVKALLWAGADPSLRNKDGWTALKLAEENGQQEVIALLQSYGAY